MTFKKLFSTGLLLVLFLLTGVVNAQVGTYYVNNQTGHDANAGTLASPLATVSAALSAAPAGSTISVATTGINYTEGNVIVSKTITFTSTGGTPIFSNADLSIGSNGVHSAIAGNTGAAANAASTITTAIAHGLSTNDQVYIDGTGTTLDDNYFTVTVLSPTTFSVTHNVLVAASGAVGNIFTRGTLTVSGPFQFQDLKLNQGTLAGGNQVTIAGGDVYRTELGSVTSGQVAFTGATNFVYENFFTAAGATVTTGFEFPTATNLANNLTTTATAGNITFRLDQNRTINGLMLLGQGGNNGGANLNTFTLNFISGAGALNHFTDGNITNGTLNFTLGAGAISIDANSASTLANVTASKAAAGLVVLTIDPVGASNFTSVGNLIANTNASITTNNTTTVGTVTLNGAGTMTIANGTNVGAVLGATGSTGTITLAKVGAAAQTIASITQSGNGFINFAATAATSIAITTNVLLNTSYTVQSGVGAVALAAGSQINFPNIVLTVGGFVRNQANVTGTTDIANANNVAQINFGNTGTTIAITGLLSNESTGTWVAATGGALSNFGRITFATTTGALTFTGGITNSSNVSGATSGDIFSTGAGGAATINSGAVLNSSTVANNQIDFSNLNGANTFTGNISSTGATTGGDILFGNGNVVGGTRNVENSRGVAGADITFGTAATGGTTVTLNNITNSGASNISFLSTQTGAVTINGTVSLTSSGDVLFTNSTTATYAIVGLTVNGTGAVLDFGDQTVGANQGAINVTGTVQLVNGTVDMGQNTGFARTMTFSGASIQIGGATTNVTYNNATTATIDFNQPIPNVNQVVSLGNASQTYPGPMTVTNPAVLPAPYVIFQSINPAVPGSLTLNGGGLTFNTGVAVANTIRLDNARLYVGTPVPTATGGNFQNTSGYTTTNGGFVMMYGGVAQVVNPVAGPNAGATFGNFGVDNNSGANTTFGNATCTFVGDFYLAQGNVVPTNMIFNTATSVAPWPTIFRTAGTFNANIGGFITATTRVNVTYYGADKTTANEVPNGATQLHDLTVATTTGVQPGQGIVTLGANAQPNGTFTINTGQSLFTAGNNLILNGASAVNNGWLADDGTTRVQLNAATGTALTGTGLWPSLQVNNNSAGNTLVDGTGLVSQGFGGDNVWGGVGGNADDFATKDGVITFLAAGTASSLAVSFTGNGPHVAGITTAANGTLTLNSNVVSSGTVAVGVGTIALGANNLTCQAGTAPDAMTITGAAVAPFGQVTGTGTVIYSGAAANITIAGAAATIAANVQFTGAAATFAGFNLRFDGNVTLGTIAPTVNTFTIPNGLTLTAGGQNVLLYSTSAFASPATGILNLVNTAPNTLLTWTVPAAATPTVANLNVGGNVTLAGPASLTVNGTGTGFVMNAGATNTLTIGNANLIIGGGAIATPFRYIDGLFAGAGYLDWNSTSTWRMDAPMAIGNLQVDRPLDITRANNNAITNTLTVTSNLYLNGAGGGLTGALTQTRTVAPLGSMLNVAANATILVDGTGNIDNAVGQAVPVFAGLVNYLFGGATSTPNNFTWPQNQANNVTLNNTGAVAVTIPNAAGNSKVIAGTLTLTSGTLTWDSPTDVSMPTAGQKIVRNVNGALNNDQSGGGAVGTFTAPDINIDYTGFAAGPVVYNTGLEYSLPGIVRDVTLLAMVAPNQTMVAINSSRTIAGVLTLNSVLTFNGGFTTNFTLAQTIAATGTVNVLATAIVNWNAGLAVNGAYVNAGTTAVTGNLSGTGAVTNNNVFTLGGLNLTGASVLTLGNASTTTLTGNATIAGFTIPAFVAGAPAEVGATISTNSDLTFGAAAWGGGNLLNLTFTGTNTQAVALGANRQINNLNMTKGGDQAVTVSGGNLTLNPVQDGVIQPAGVLTLTRGILAMADPTLLTLQLTTNAGGVITNLGYVRNLALSTHFAHVSGRLGVFIPAGTIGRSEWPVGTANPSYRPAAITFTAGNATIAPTTVVVSHVNTTPTGTKNFPINGGTKFADPSRTNWIGGKAPYYWVFEATTSLGAAQLMNVELNGTNLNRPLDNHNDLRIIRRFDGDVTVNGWFLEGGAGNYSNAMYINTPLPGDTLLVVRNIGSQGSAIAQRAFFTLGIPSGAPVFTATAPAAVTTPENTLYTFTFAATDQDVNVGTPTFTLVNNPPTGAAITAAGVFTWTPSFDQGRTAPYPITVRATKATDATVFTDYTFNITVTNVNRAPTWTGGTTHTTATVVQGQTLNLTYAAVDPDGDALTYARAVAPAPAGANSIAAGVLTFTPTLADAAGGPYVFTITANDGALTANTTTTVTVTYGRNKGDVDGDGDVDGIDASLVLQHVVGKTTPAPLPLTGVALWAADCNSGVGDGVVGAYDAYLILYKVLNPTLPFPAKVSAAMGKVELGRLSGENGIINVPITLTNTMGVTSAYAELETGSLEVASVKVTTANGWVSSTNTEGGKVRIALTGLEPLKDGVVALVSFKLNGQETVTVTGSAVLNDDLREELNAVNVREIPTEFALSQNYPNPFNPTTSIKYSLAENAKVTLVIYDMLGQVVKTLIDNEQEAGFYTVKWDGTNNYGGKVSSGIYIYRLNAGKFMSTLKMNLLK